MAVRGQSVIITGASRGIGAAAARHLAAEGAKLVLAARSTGEIDALAREIRDAGGEAIAHRVDVSHWGDVRDLVATAVEHFGRLDLLVNNAGLIDPIARLGDSDPEAWARVADVNYKG
ncbi:MAG: SDR family NAD(P)-dependent oxidoreductase, partial [Pseudomonadota bacterium]